jgi:hypothetical protein
MQTMAAEVEYFNEKGRRKLTAPYRVFDAEYLEYYYIQNPQFDYESIAGNYRAVDFPGFSATAKQVEDACTQLKQKFLSIPAYRGLFSGVHIPFVLPKISPAADLGKALIEDRLPYLEASFKKRYPEARFKAIMQGGSTLSGNVKIAEKSRYDELLRAAEHSPIAGWYFPQALQQFDIESQVRQMTELPAERGVCLSGPAEIISALIGKPDLLINNDSYSPILCMSAVEHADERLALLMKAYGPHLEFWCLSQMLAPSVKQVSEQWAGGVTLYQSLN